MFSGAASAAGDSRPTRADGAFSRIRFVDDPDELEQGHTTTETQAGPSTTTPESSEAPAIITPPSQIEDPLPNVESAPQSGAA